MSEKHKLEEIIAYLENQRGNIDDHLINAAITPLKNSLSSTTSSYPSQEQRKQVTILFADISGFTAMSEKMDAEDVHNFIQVLWNKLDNIVLEHGGKIDKHIGDAIMALWGVHSTREDDPERAVRAALAMQQEIQQWQQELQESAVLPTQQTLSVRIGINTGPVILGRIGTMGEYTAMGDTVNTASRLEKFAPTGNILISRSTYLHVRGIFDLRERAPLQAKGKKRPLETYLVQRERPRSFHIEQRGIKGVTTPMIGRSNELEWLQQKYYNMLLEGTQFMGILSGEAGLGKTRLIYEFGSWVESLSWKTSFFKARARQGTKDQPYNLITELIRSYFNILYSDHAEVAREKITVKINQEVSNEEQRKRLGDVCKRAVGIDLIDPELAYPLNGDANSSSPKFNNPEAINIGPQLLPTITEFFQEISAREPTLIFLEDIHWADSTSLQFINQLHMNTDDQFLMIAATARPDFFGNYPQWAQSEPEHYGNLKLTPLNEKDSRELIHSILHRAEQIPEKLYTNIIDRTEGNPYHIEEFIKMLIADNVIIQGKTKWSIRKDKLVNVKVPTTVINILQARIDRLPSYVRRVMRCASVLGRLFWDDGVTRIVEDAGIGDAKMVNDALTYLVENQIITEQPSPTMQLSREFTFNNTLLHQVTYEGILKRERRIYHKSAGKWLREAVENDMSEEHKVISQHSKKPVSVSAGTPQTESVPVATFS